MTAAPPPILYEDAELLIIDKPAGLAVHPGPKTPRSLEDFLPALSLGYHRDPAPAHRLDRDTSGCLVLGRGPRALKRLHGLFAAGEITKTYVAVLAGVVEGAGVIEVPLVKINSRAAGWRMVPAKKAGNGGARGAKTAITAWRALERRGDTTLVEFSPRTGRTHQIRVHAAHALAPILGDPVYGAGLHGDQCGDRAADQAAARMWLHACNITFPWRGDRIIAAAAPLPSGF